jgi:hypothetical protein
MELPGFLGYVGKVIKNEKEGLECRKRWKCNLERNLIIMLET